MASLLLVMGLKLTDVLEFDMPVIIKAMPVNNTNSLFLYPVLLGIAFALAGTPCSTPILAGIMAFAAMGKNLAAAVFICCWSGVNIDYCRAVYFRCKKSQEFCRHVCRITESKRCFAYTGCVVPVL